MSVVAMVLVNMAMHEIIQSQVKPVSVLSFVDNWECKSSQVDATLRAWTALESFATTIDVRLDQTKTHFWAVRPKIGKH